MLITIVPTDPRPIYVQIVDEIRRALVLHSLSVGDPLPSVRHLAAQLRVNPNTVSQAYQELERDGVVEVRRGQGTFVLQSSVGVAQRRVLARDVATRALRDAHRNGLTAEDLIHAVRAATTLHARKEA